MKNPAAQAFFTIILAGILLLAWIFFFPTIELGKWKETDWFFKSPPKSLITDYSLPENQKDFDVLLNKYIGNANFNTDSLISRKSLSGISPKINSAHLTNPGTDGIYALDAFFKTLLKEKDTSLVRVAHYGDSQLEGDRMTYVIRKKFQDKFGGSGVGYVPITDIVGSRSYGRFGSGNWIRYTVFHNKFKNSFYGMSGHVYRFMNAYTVIKPDSLRTEGDTDTATLVTTAGGWVSVRNYGINYQKVSLLYGFNEDSCKLDCYDAEDNSLLYSDVLPPAQGFVKKDLSLARLTRKLKVSLEANPSPNVYGLLFDSHTGVQVDNYSIRGHSGSGLMLINQDFLQTQIETLNTHLVIFQYGANVVPYIKSDEACEQLEDIYYQLFMKFKSANPDISILVIGAGDMARKFEGKYASYAYLPKIRDAQKKAALRAGCAFWDLFELMGGLNSIMAWSKKRLASTDGHFSNKGQELVANELFNSILSEYNMYKYRQKQQ